MVWREKISFSKREFLVSKFSCLACSMNILLENCWLEVDREL